MSVMSTHELTCPKALEFERLRVQLAVALATDESPNIIRALERRIGKSWESIDAADGAPESNDRSLCCLGE